MAGRSLFSRIIYRSTYLFLYIILLGLLLITPGDAIQRSQQNGQNYNILIIAVCYVATVLIVGFVYVLRLYVNKTALSAIPKAWIPIDRGDVKERVYKMINARLNRSAAITYLSRPRDIAPTDQDFRPLSGYMAPQRLGMKSVEAIGQDVGIRLPSQRALWGTIEQNGWASPNAQELPNLQYSTVLSELPNLVEAKALTLAPIDPTTSANDPPIDPPLLDAEAAALLQRQAGMSLRQYLEHLADLGVVDMEAGASEFLNIYEDARFSNKPMSGAKFKEMMNLFADILRTMTAMDRGYIASELEQEISESDIDSDAPLATNPTTSRSNVSRSWSRSRSPSGSANSRRRPSPPRRNSSLNAWSLYATAPNTPVSRRTGAISRMRSNNSLVATPPSRQGYLRSQRSHASLRSEATSSSGSVIRLATREDNSELPYVLSLRTSID